MSNLVHDDDQPAYRAGRLLFLKTIDDYVGLPFSLFAVATWLLSAPQKLRELGWRKVVVTVAIALAVWYFLPSLRVFFIQLEFALTMFYLNIWLFLLPFTLIGLLITIACNVMSVLRSWQLEEGKQLLRNVSRTCILGLIFWLSLHYKDAVEAYAKSLM